MRSQRGTEEGRGTLKRSPPANAGKDCGEGYGRRRERAPFFLTAKRTRGWKRKKTVFGSDEVKGKREEEIAGGGGGEGGKGGR